LNSVPLNQFFFIDKERGISGGINTYEDFVIHRFFYQPQQTQNIQQRDYFYKRVELTLINYYFKDEAILPNGGII
jgi:hypothetical protein